jgi:hypothetical protein
MKPDKREIAAAGAEWHAQSYCSHMRDEDRQRVGEVIFDLIYSSLEVYEGLIEDGLKNRPYPIAFSSN